MEKKDKKKRIALILMIVFGAVFVVSLLILIIKSFPNNSYKKSKKDPAPSSSVTSEVLVDNPIDFAELKAQNDNVCGYITVDGTVVDYPVLRSDESLPEDYYLNHDWLKNSKFAGSIYMQKCNSSDFSDNCTLLYGHNMLDGSMFAGLRKFRNEDFFNENKYITICTPGHILKYEIYSAFTYDDRHIIHSFDFSKQEDFELFVHESLNPRSLETYHIRESAAPVWGDKIVVLSTCTDAYGDLRYLVAGKLIEDTKTN